MPELFVLSLFCVILIACVALSLPIVGALAVGLLLFCLYGRYRGRGWGELARMGASGIVTVRGVLTAFVLIGVLTAFWRASGTVAEIVIIASPLVSAAVAPLATFALCGVMSFLTGTAFGTAATMGVVCMTLASSMGADLLICGGAVLSGSYFGDRCSPLSTSALLVRVVTHTELGENFRAMLKSAAVPFALAVALYAVLGFAYAPARGASSLGTVDALARTFDQGLVALVPAALVLVLPLFRVSVKGAMGASIVAAAAVCVFVRGIAPADLARFALVGYSSSDAAMQQLMGGGGLTSMINVACIVCLSSSYSGIFEGTGLLAGVQGHIAGLAERLTPFGAVLAVSIPASMIACNQTLSTMLTHQLCAPVEPDEHAMAIDLEDTVIVIAPLIPWSVACSAVSTMCGAPGMSFALAVYLWLIPVCRFCAALLKRRRAGAVQALAA